MILIRCPLASELCCFLTVQSDPVFRQILSFNFKSSITSVVEKKKNFYKIKQLIVFEEKSAKLTTVSNKIGGFRNSLWKPQLNRKT